jgi:hypothetical protein
MNIFINEFLLKNERAERGLVFEDLRTGDPVDPNQIIKQFIYGNQQKFESWSNMRRKIDAAKLLGIADETLREWFDRRGKLGVYNLIMENQFKAFSITKPTLESFQRMSEEKRIPNPMSEVVLEKLGIIEELLNEKSLNSTYDIDYERFKMMPPGAITIEWPEDKQSKLPASSLPTPPLPPTPQPKVATNVAQPSQIPGLTRTETALLSPREQAIKQNQRGTV